MIQTEAFQKIKSYFGLIETIDIDIYQMDIERIAYMCDGFELMEILNPFRDELKHNLVLLPKEKHVPYLKSLLSDSPLYLRNESFIEEKCHVIEYIKDPENNIKNGPIKYYIIKTYHIWTSVQEIIKECCIVHDIECIEEKDSNGIKNITSFNLLNEEHNYEEDLSNTTPTEKILYLHEVGIINFLKDIHPFKNNINRLARLFSAITGEKQSTISSTLNAIINNPDSTKNPYNTQKKDSLNKVLAELKKIGFDPIKSIS